MQWTPHPAERSYYDTLFHHVDINNQGYLTGSQAVSFFSQSGLDTSILRQIWSIADARQQSVLHQNEFYVAMRLLGMAQGGEMNLCMERLIQMGSMNLPLARLQGYPSPPTPVVGSSNPNPPQSVGNGYGSGGRTENVGTSYMATEDEKRKYATLFTQYDNDRDGFIIGSEAVEIFQKSGLNRQILKTVWNISDVDQDHQLNMAEFSIAMHLIVCVSKRGLTMPTTLPEELKASIFGNSIQKQSGNADAFADLASSVGMGSMSSSSRSNSVSSSSGMGAPHLSHMGSSGQFSSASMGGGFSQTGEMHYNSQQNYAAGGPSQSLESPVGLSGMDAFNSLMPETHDQTLDPSPVSSFKAPDLSSLVAPSSPMGFPVSSTPTAQPSMMSPMAPSVAATPAMSFSQSISTSDTSKKELDVLNRKCLELEKASMSSQDAIWSQVTALESVLLSLQKQSTIRSELVSSCQQKNALQIEYAQCRQSSLEKSNSHEISSSEFVDQIRAMIAEETSTSLTLRSEINELEKQLKGASDPYYSTSSSNDEQSQLKTNGAAFDDEFPSSPFNNSSVDPFADFDDSFGNFETTM